MITIGYDEFNELSMGVDVLETKTYANFWNNRPLNWNDEKDTPAGRPFEEFSMGGCVRVFFSYKFHSYLLKISRAQHPART